MGENQGGVSSSTSRRNSRCKPGDPNFCDGSTQAGTRCLKRRKKGQRESSECKRFRSTESYAGAEERSTGTTAYPPHRHRPIHHASRVTGSNVHHQRSWPNILRFTGTWSSGGAAKAESGPGLTQPTRAQLELAIQQALLSTVQQHYPLCWSPLFLLVTPRVQKQKCRKVKCTVKTQ